MADLTRSDELAQLVYNSLTLRLWFFDESSSDEVVRTVNKCQSVMTVDFLGRKRLCVL